MEPASVETSALEESVPSGQPFYDPLDASRKEIRVLVLKNQSDDSIAVECVLEKLSLLQEDHPKFFALSYVWGDDVATDPVTINGRQFQVTSSLLSFLCNWRAIRPQSLEAMPVWVDAACINQADVDERNSQITLMGSIYKKAYAVLSWLGEEENDSDLALNTFETFAREVPTMTDMQDIGWLQQYPELCLNDTKTYLGNAAWNSIQRLMGRMYWKRTWIFQELAYADILIVLCGNAMCSLDSIFLVRLFLRALHQRPKPSFMDHKIWLILSSPSTIVDTMRAPTIDRIMSVRKEVLGTSSQSRLGSDQERWKVGLYSRHMLSSDPKDKVYGLLALSRLSIVPDYKKSVRDVYCEFAATGLQLGMIEHVLGQSGCGLTWVDQKDWRRAQQPHSNSWNLPSWTPDLDSLTEEKILRRFPINVVYEASGHEYLGDTVRTFRELSVKDGVLLASGIVCVEILTIHLIEDYESLFKISCDYLSRSRVNKYPTGIPTLQALVRTLLMDCNQDMTTSRLNLKVEDSQRLVCALLCTLLSHTGRISKGSLKQLGFSPRNPGNAIHFELLGGLWTGSSIFKGKSFKELLTIAAQGSKLDEAATWVFTLFNWAFFETQNSYIGICPPLTRPGDIVCVLLDSKIPVILRKAGSHYVHVGACFVQGFMDGEAVKDLQAGKRSLQTFDIH